MPPEEAPDGFVAKRLDVEAPGHVEVPGHLAKTAPRSLESLKYWVLDQGFNFKLP